jgi:heterodisulfide reductase subunit B
VKLHLPVVYYTQLLGLALNIEAENSFRILTKAQLINFNESFAVTT